MTRTADWIAVDWGTTNVRAWAIGADGSVLAQTETTAGMGTLAPEDFEPVLISMIDGWLETGRRTLVQACGMIGARQGWTEAAYRPVPCDPLGVDTMTIAPCLDPRIDVRIVPGLSQSYPPDVIRGEETQIAGVLAKRDLRDGVVCLPGTHTKWVRLEAGAVAVFTTAMTGELFALLEQQSVLRHSVEDGWDSGAFEAGVAEILDDPGALAIRLFGLRAASLLRGMDGAAGRSRLSGLLIGSELSAVRDLMSLNDVSVVGADPLASHYRIAIRAAGGRAETLSGPEITLAGLRLAQAMLKETAG